MVSHADALRLLSGEGTEIIQGMRRSVGNWELRPESSGEGDSGSGQEVGEPRTKDEVAPETQVSGAEDPSVSVPTASKLDPVRAAGTGHSQSAPSPDSTSAEECPADQVAHPEDECIGTSDSGSDNRA